MAIPLLIAGFTTLRPKRTSVGLVAYLARRTVRDGGHRYVYGPLAGDVVHEVVLLPEGASPALSDPIALARVMDAAEPDASSDRERKRYPQPGLHLVLALPHDGELHLDEALALLHGFIRRLVAGRRLAAYVALHDPAVKSGSRLRRNRHAHVVVPLRSVEGAKLSRRKERDLVARVRAALGADAIGRRRVYVAEGVRWPDAWWGAQNRQFLELGLRTRVQPIAARPGRHYDRQMWRYDADAVEADRRRLRGENRRLAEDDPPILVETLARGRSTLLLSDLRAFLERIIPEPHLRARRLDAICTHPSVVALAGTAADPRPDRIATVAVHALMREAVAAIGAAAGSPQARLICVRAGDAGKTQEGVADAVAAIRARGGRTPPIVTVGVRLSHAEMVPGDVSLRTTPDDLVARGDRWDRGTLVVAPRAEMVSDVALAHLVVEAGRRDWTLVLGVNDEAADGVVDRRFAAVAAGYLAPRTPPADAPAFELRRIAALRLRAGYVDEGVAALFQSTTFGFSGTGRADPERLTLTVRDREPFGQARERNVDTASAIPRAGGDWTPGAWVIASATDYGTLPPILRAGRLYEIVAVRSDRPDGAGSASLDLRDVSTGMTLTTSASCLRPAHALTIREAWMLKDRLTAALRIVISDPRSAWAALLLAAEWQETAAIGIEIEPHVATSPVELVDRVCASLPAALAPDCTPRLDEEARTRIEIDRIMDALIPDGPEVVDQRPPATRSADAAASAPIDLSALPPELAAAAVVDPLVRAGLRAKRKALRDKPAANPRDSLAEALASQLPKPPRRGRRPAHPDELDLPVAMTDQDRGAPDLWEAYRLHVEARLLSLETVSNRMRDPNAPDVYATETPLPASGDQKDAKDDDNDEDGPPPGPGM